MQAVVREDSIWTGVPIESFCDQANGIDEGMTALVAAEDDFLVGYEAYLASGVATDSFCLQLLCVRRVRDANTLLRMHCCNITHALLLQQLHPWWCWVPSRWYNWYQSASVGRGSCHGGGKLCHLRDLQKACATLQGDAFTTWVEDKKAWYAPLAKDKRFNKSKKGATQTNVVSASASSSENEEQDEHNKTVSPAPAAPGKELGRGCRREKIQEEMRPNLSTTTLINKN